MKKINLFVGIVGIIVALIQTLILWENYPISSIIIWNLVIII